MSECLDQFEMDDSKGISKEDILILNKSTSFPQQQVEMSCKIYTWIEKKQAAKECEQKRIVW